ncbi:DUF5994 family protein [Streptomyces rectiviolaceus]|uniref:DUF5994 family protein n=1 Tax=Streptomyces rectiviolaceus TaxID=332591 RepID=UPI00363C6405
MAQELSTLADVLDPLWGRITRIAVNPMHWPVVPREIPVNGHVVKVGWFTTELDPHKIMLLSYTAGRWDLMVIPPESSAPAAARLMAAASESPGLPATASRLIAAEQALHGGSAADRGPVAEEDEARDGGGFPSSPALVALPSHLAMEV